MKDNIVSLLGRSQGFHDFYKGYVKYLHDLLLALDPADLERLVDMFLQTRERGKTIYFAGNGGSASTSSHFAQDLSEIGTKAGTRGFRTQSLADNVSYITAAGNDFGFEHIFTAQMKNVFESGDMLVAISASGNSPNVVAAVKLARERGGSTAALVGFDGGELAHQADLAVVVRTPKGEYGPVEDAHMIFDHLVVTWLTHLLKATA